MFQIGDIVVSSNNGICRIEKETWENWSGEERCYYLLIPNDSSGTKIYIPVESADNKLRRIMTKDEALAFIENIESILPIHIENERFCEKEYKEALYQGAQQNRVALLKTLYKRINTRTSSAKKATIVDERYCKLAENMLFSELSFSLGVEKDELMKKVKRAMQNT